MQHCPVCGSREIGKISTLYYFCRHCFNEFNLKAEAFKVLEDGSLLQISGGEMK